MPIGGVISKEVKVGLRMANFLFFLLFFYPCLAVRLYISHFLFGDLHMHVHAIIINFF